MSKGFLRSEPIPIFGGLLNLKFPLMAYFGPGDHLAVIWADAISFGKYNLSASNRSPVPNAACLMFLNPAGPLCPPLHSQVFAIVCVVIQTITECWPAGLYPFNKK